MNRDDKLFVQELEEECQELERILGEQEKDIESLQHELRILICRPYQISRTFCGFQSQGSVSEAARREGKVAGGAFLAFPGMFEALCFVQQGPSRSGGHFRMYRDRMAACRSSPAASGITVTHLPK